MKLCKNRRWMQPDRCNDPSWAKCMHKDPPHRPAGHAVDDSK
jgi:hypothetical protein